jgi:hypothetical protein
VLSDSLQSGGETTMIKYSQIENLPDNHPLVIQFKKEQAALDNCPCAVCSGEVAEDSLEHFNKFVAGDR